MKRFKYKTEYFKDQNDLETALSQYGNEGWELISIVTIPKAKEFNEGIVFFAIFKQEN